MNTDPGFAKGGNRSICRMDHDLISLFNHAGPCSHDMLVLAGEEDLSRPLPIRPLTYVGMVSWIPIYCRFLLLFSFYWTPR